MDVNQYMQKNQQKYQIFNVIPVYGIKCQHCSSIVEQQKMEAHLKLHLKEKNNNFVSQNQEQKIPASPKILNFQNLLRQQIQNHNSKQYISVKSILSDEMPCIQKSDRPKGIRLKQNSLQKKNNKFMQTFDTNFSQAINYVENIKETADEDDEVQINASIIEPSHHQELQIQKLVKLNRASSTLKKKNIKAYCKQVPKQQMLKDSHQSKRKRKLFHRIQTSQKIGQKLGYQLSPDMAQKQNKKNQQLEPITFEIPKNLKVKTQRSKISTLSTSRGFFNRQNRTPLFRNNSSLINTKTSEISQKTNQRQPNPKFTCQQCKGFYCYSCGSTIPPIYRPVPTINGHYLYPCSENNTQRSKGFFNESEKNMGGSKCNNCEGL